jgi:Protein of unknown function (DUF1838)
VHTDGARLARFEDLSATMKTEITTNYPAYSAPPPQGDPRENMTSWQAYKNAVEAKAKPPAR